MTEPTTDSALARFLANPMSRSVLISTLMRLLAVAGTALVTHGWLTQEQYASINLAEVAGTILVVASFIYGSWKNFRTQQKIVTSIANPQIKTEAELEQVIKSGGAASVTTPKDELPSTKPQPEPDKL